MRCGGFCDGKTNPNVRSQESEFEQKGTEGTYVQELAMHKVPAAQADKVAARLYPPAFWRDVCRFLAGAVAVGAPSTVSARFKHPPVRAGAVPGAPFTAADRVAARLYPPFSELFRRTIVC